MNTSKHKIVIDAQANVSKAFSQVNKSINKVQNNIRRLKPTFQSMRNYGAIAFAGIGAGILKTTNEATALGESINAVNVIFKEGADEILKFGKNSATAVGLATADFQQMSTQTGSLLSKTGLSMDDVALKTIELTKRASDLASVHNTDVKDALSAINQALRGETEAIRRYSADVTDASLQSYLLAQGIQKKVTELTQEEKILLRVQKVMADTMDVEGDFINTSDDLANKKRIMTAQFKNLSAVLGNQFIPIVNSVLNTIKPVIEQFSGWVEKNPVLFRNIVLVSLSLAGLVTVLGVVGLILPAVIGGFGALATVVTALSLPVLAIIALLVIIGATIYYIASRWTEHVDNMKWAWATFTEYIGAKIQEVSDWIYGIIENIKNWFSALVQNGIAIFSRIGSLVGGLIKLYLQPLMIVLTKGKQIWLSFKEGMKVVADYISNVFARTIGAISDKINGLISKILRAISLMQELGGKARKKVSRVASNVREGFRSITSGLNFANGGRVNAPLGSPVLATVHGGEEIIPARHVGRGANSISININGGMYTDEQSVTEFTNILLDRIKTEIRI